jgi:hypothetical protein
VEDLQQSASGNGGWTYYAKIRNGYPVERPSGIVRRRIVDGVT